MSEQPLKTTVGQLLVNEAFPAPLRDYNRVMDKKTVASVLQTLYETNPEAYLVTLQKLYRVGQDVSQAESSFSFGLSELKTADTAKEARERLRAAIKTLKNTSTSLDDFKEKIIVAASKEQDHLLKSVLVEEKNKGNRLAKQVLSGARGNAAQLNRLIAGDMLYTDHKGRVIPLPVTSTYSEGLSPVEYWAASFGARKGIIDVNMGTRQGGFFSKQLAQLANRLLVSSLDEASTETQGVRGYSVEVSDPDNEGALLAMPVGGYSRNTVLTPKILADLQSKKVKNILIRSPIVGGPEDGGVYARDVGVRETGNLARIGDMVGLAASQSVGERVAQGMLGSKHSGGVKGKVKPSFQQINLLFQMPKESYNTAVHAQLDGKVDKIEEAPAGGWHITIQGKQHYVSENNEVIVKEGQAIEAGDVLSSGIPNPGEIVRHKGIGEGRKYFVNTLVSTLKAADIPVHRRNAELLARGLIDHVEMQDVGRNYLPGDVMYYHQLEKKWKTRPGTETASVRKAIGKYLESPVLHYSIGTKIQPSMMPLLQEYGIKELKVHNDPPPFKPLAVRSADILAYDPDFLTQMLGSYHKRRLLDATVRGGESDITGTSYVPALIEGGPMGDFWPSKALKFDKSPDGYISPETGWMAKRQ